MFGINKKDLIVGLNKLSSSVCAYNGPRCDCKYGVDVGTARFGSEQNGCPESKMASRIIAAMTDEEFADLCKRAKIEISGWTRPDDEKRD